ncbi:MAG: IS5 family transposase [Chitinophagaceae bacterium]
MAFQPGFFDVEHRIEKIQQYNSPLLRLADYIDFEFFRKELETYFRKGKDYSKGGRPPYDYVLMFKILIIQHFYNISDDQTEFCINDRFSFMQFLNLQLGQRIPDAKTIWNFKNELSREDMINKLFAKLHKQLLTDGIVVSKGSIVDASFVNVPRQRNSREENEQIKQGDQPKDWSDVKACQKDLDARWTKKDNETHYGYKDHVKADAATKLITGYEVTDASVHDSQMLDELLNKEDKTVYADSAYRSEAQEERLVAAGIESRIMEKGARNRSLTNKQIKNNKMKSKIRVRVEHIFGYMTNSMNGMFIKSIGIDRAKTAIGMKNLVYNLFRLTQLNIELRA